MSPKSWILALFLSLSSMLSALENDDRQAIQNVVQGYTDAWNYQACKGFADDFTDDADFVNIFGMEFSGKAQIEDRHLKILQGIHKESKFTILSTQLREINPGLVIAKVRWSLDNFRFPGSDLSKPGSTQTGIFTQVFIKQNDKWQITASQNTLDYKFNKILTPENTES